MIKRITISAEQMTRYHDMLNLEIKLDYELDGGGPASERMLSSIPMSDFIDNTELIFREMYRKMKARVLQQLQQKVLVAR